eukprot:574295-Pyramimonas_sp.AAC.1
MTSSPYLEPLLRFVLAGVLYDLFHLEVDELGLESNGLEECILEPLGSAWAKRPFSRVRLSDNAIPRETIVNF